MNVQPTDRVVYINAKGQAHCVDARAIVPLPQDLQDPLFEICGDMQHALDCIRIFGGIPIPVAKAILANIEPAHAAIDLAMRATPTAEA